MAGGGLDACSATIHFSRLGEYDETVRAIGWTNSRRVKGGHSAYAFAHVTERH